MTAPNDFEPLPADMLMDFFNGFAESARIPVCEAPTVWRDHALEIGLCQFEVQQAELGGHEGGVKAGDRYMARLNYIAAKPAFPNGRFS